MKDDQEPPQNFRFVLGQVVRLKNDYSDVGLTAGDCGVIWTAANDSTWEEPFF